MRLIILVVIIAVAVAAGFGMLMLSGPAQTAAPVASVPQAGGQVATVDVWVARTDIPVGTRLTPEMIDKQPWPRNLVLDSFMTVGPGMPDVVGMVAREDFRAREPLLKSKLSGADEPGFLAASLDKGMRAVTLATDPVSGVAGYLFPGDRVDVLLTHSLPQQEDALMRGAHTNSAAAMGMGGAEQSATTSEVLLPDLKVLAVNVRKSASPLADVAMRLPVAGADSPGNVTLEMSQENAKKIRLAEKNGQLSLALRSLKDGNDTSVGEPVTLLDLSQADDEHHEKAAPHASSNNDVVVIRGVMEDHPSARGMMPGGAAASILQGVNQ